MDAAAMNVLADPAFRARQMIDLGFERLKAGDKGNARAMFLGAIEADADCADAYNNLGIIASRPLQHGAAIALGFRALALKPGEPRFMMNLGVRLWEDCRYEEAVVWLERAALAAPGDAETQQRLGLGYYALDRMPEAVAALERALELRPDNIPTKSDLSLALMKAGDFKRGLEHHEVRWQMIGRGPAWELDLPHWEGEDLTGKRILVHYEQGGGDAIMFARWIMELRRRWPSAWITFAASKPLARLFTDRFGIDEIIDWYEPGPLVRVGRRADYHCPMMSLLRVMGADFDGLPSREEPYVRVSGPSPPEARTAFKGPGCKLAVGLVWKTSRRSEAGYRRSPGLGQWCELVEVPGVRLYSLQAGADSRTELEAAGADCVITDLSPNIQDFADVAKLMDGLDLVVSIDTGPLHLAGAMGKRTLFLNQFNSCWRWCRGVGAWYTNMEEFRQTDPLCWKGPVAAVKARIAEIANA